MLEELDRLYGPLNAPRVIPNGRDASRYAPARKEPFVMAAGRLWDEAKNVAALAAAASGLDWPVYVAGEASDPSGRRLEAGALHFTGSLSARELANWYARASIYALPARYEPFGLSILEAALSGAALVLGDIPSLRENWTGAAAFVPPDDRSALTETLNHLIRNESARTGLARSARQRALEFTPRRMADGYLCAYEAANRLSMKARN
jgi:glycosyltransferase involved in cell wall biosynthesis